MELSQFESMIIHNNWCAIRYTVKIKNLDTGEEVLQNTVEFVTFKENPEPVGVRLCLTYRFLHSANRKYRQKDMKIRKFVIGSAALALVAARLIALVQAGKRKGLVVTQHKTSQDGRTR